MKSSTSSKSTEKAPVYRITRKYEGKTSAQAFVLNLIRAHAA